MSVFTKLFGSYSDRQIKKILPIVDKIESLDAKFTAMSDDELRGQTAVLKQRLQNGESLNDIMPEAYAAVREAAWRVLGKKHYRVQLMGGVVLHQGRIAELKTGEGKTLMETLPAYLNALSGNGVHIVTVNEYLARRDSEWMGNIYRFLGLTVGLIYSGQSGDDKRQAYAADITYGTSNEFGFDYLRDNMCIYKSSLVQRGHAFAIVDEVDSILIDEARTPLIISGKGEQSSELYKRADRFVSTLSCHRIKEHDGKQGDVDENNNEIKEDYIVDEKANTAVLTGYGVEKAEKFFGVENLGDGDNIELMHYINNALRARGVMKRDVDYVVKDGAVLIVDSFTGRIMYGRRFNNGLHQAIEAKENVTVADENKTCATITIQNYFRLYRKLSGMTGTAETEENEFREIYSLDVVVIPTNRPMIRKDNNDWVFKTEAGKYKAIVRQIEECQAKGQPVLVGTVSVEKSEKLSEILKRKGIKHNVLNAKFHEREAEIIAQAGKFGAVTIATNMAGRGTDIMLGGNSDFMAKQQLRKEGYDEETIYLATGYANLEDETQQKAREEYTALEKKFASECAAEAEKVRKAGGLFILGTERHESRRIDNQLRGRAGRQGDPGESRFFISFEDDLLRLFGANERVSAIVNSMPIAEDEPIDLKLMSNTVENAQERMEGRNFERRKNVLQYDDVVNKQRELIYSQRRDVLNDADLSGQIAEMTDEYIRRHIDECCQSDVADEWNFAALHAAFDNMFGTEDAFNFDASRLGTLDKEELFGIVHERAVERYSQQEKLFEGINFREIERATLLMSVDKHWIDHIDAMSDLQDSIGLNAYAGRNPLVEFKIAGGEMFDSMIEDIREETVRRLYLCRPKRAEEQTRKQIFVPLGLGSSKTKQAVRAQVRSGLKKVGPNDPCPCGSGKKYKKCCGSVAQGKE